MGMVRLATGTDGAGVFPFLEYAEGREACFHEVFIGRCGADSLPTLVPTAYTGIGLPLWDDPSVLTERGLVAGARPALGHSTFRAGKN